MTIAFMGIDLDKNVFQFHGVDAVGKAVFNKRVRREALLAELADVSTCRIGIEAVRARAGGSANSRLSVISSTSLRPNT